MAQPVDVSLFRGMNIWWGKHLQKFTRKNPGVQVNTNNFPNIFIPFLIDLLSESENAIANGFKISGLFPF